MVRVGRLSNEERLLMLNEYGKIAQEKFDDLLDRNTFQYNLEILKGGLKFEPDIQNFENEYYIEYEDEDLEKIFTYFEYGTGIWSTKGPKEMIKPINKKVMKWTKKGGGWIFAGKVKGVRPIFMFDLTMALMQNDAESLFKKTRKKLGI